MRALSKSLFASLILVWSLNTKGQSYQGHLNEINTYLKTFDNGYYGPLVVSNGYLKCFIKSYDTYSQIPIESIGRVEIVSDNEKVAIYCEGNSDCVKGVTGGMYDNMPFSSDEWFNSDRLAAQLKELVFLLKEGNNSVTTYTQSGEGYQWQLDEINTFLKTFDNGYYGPLRVTDGYIKCYIKSYNTHSQIPIASIDDVEIVSPNSKLKINCRGGGDCVKGVTGDMYPQMSFSSDTWFDSDRFARRLRNLISLVKSGSSSTPSYKSTPSYTNTSQPTNTYQSNPTTTNTTPTTTTTSSTPTYNKNEKRVALIFGNSNYSGSASLGMNPINDARDISSTLRSIGFEVILKTDASLTTMNSAIRDFGKANRDADVAMFYFAGHGMQLERTNYLVPIGAEISEPQDVGFECISVSTVQNIMETSNDDRLNLIVLDACRNNPFRSWERGGATGLADMTPPSGTLIAFATSPGSVASNGSSRNGLYTGELIKQLKVPQRIEDVFINTRVEVERKSGGNQSPWELARLRGKFSLLTY